MIQVHDMFLEEHIAQLVDLHMREISWKYDYSSVEGGKNKHWHVLGGHNVVECFENGYEFVEPIWNTIQRTFTGENEVEMERVYFNAHTHGIEPHVHLDDGDVTMIYYPRMDWEKEDGGGTMVQEPNQHPAYLQYVGNRLIAFTASLPHQGQPVSRECYKLRTVVVFKTVFKDKNKSAWFNKLKGKKLDMDKVKIAELDS
tara:strand:- start:1128 stop:1727 length:600 start_codon:yes stop_codon:yes gene_type:complete